MTLFVLVIAQVELAVASPYVSTLPAAAVRWNCLSHLPFHVRLYYFRSSKSLSDAISERTDASATVDRR